jgi:hypothetical protein
MERLVPVKDPVALKAIGLFNSPAVVRKWHSINRHPGLTCRVGRSLYVRAEVWERLCSEAIEESDRRAERHAHAMRPIERV